MRTILVRSSQHRRLMWILVMVVICVCSTNKNGAGKISDRENRYRMLHSRTWRAGWISKNGTVRCPITWKERDVSVTEKQLRDIANDLEIAPVSVSLFVLNVQQ